MRVGVLSDIHANAIGLEAVLKEMGIVDLVVNCGDFTGFHTCINESMDRFREMPVETLRVLGNHDSYLLRGAPPEKDAKIQTSVEYSKGKISPGNMRYLRSLEPTLSFGLDGKKVLVCHGSPWDPLEEYIYPNCKRFSEFEKVNADIIIMGHTHYAFVKQMPETTLLNPGSVGQPRGPNKMASFATMDTETMRAEIRYVDCFKQEVWREISIGGNRKCHGGVD